jgi:hypothetical protein
MTCHTRTATMRRISPARPVEQAEVLAISALDELVANVIAFNRLCVPQPFLDWVSTEVTHLVEQRARRWALVQTPTEAATDPAAIRRMVHGWVMPRIAQRLGELATGRHNTLAPRPAARPGGAHSNPVNTIDVTLP